jgi:hypothetical protein
LDFIEDSRANKTALTRPREADWLDQQDTLFGLNSQSAPEENHAREPKISHVCEIFAKRGVRFSPRTRYASMITKLLALCLAVIGLGSLAAPRAEAHQTVADQTRTAAASLPSAIHLNPLVVVREGDDRGEYHRSRSYHRGSGYYHGSGYSSRTRYRTVRRVYYRDGRRVVVVRRVRIY